jgi:hypothetical protein
MLATKSDLLRGVLLHVPAWAIVATAWVTVVKASI